jgi:hypothetical protein
VANVEGSYDLTGLNGVENWPARGIRWSGFFEMCQGGWELSFEIRRGIAAGELMDYNDSLECCDVNTDERRRLAPAE